ncbi:MAG: condensation domain-containing protein, partial [Thermodesulfobacteriota bacterium]|nr:condensation domain-containing protein [Thermodesulfobacteriota bacterium]
YLNDSERTKKAFVKNPFGQGSVYKTGDLGRWLPDGNIECLGRIDHQVKIRGYRIELGEIESVLSNYPLIDDCVVVDKDDKEGNKHILAYYVSHQEISVSDLRKFLKETLPDYMLPTRFIPLESFPLTPSGKVDRNALPEPEGLRPEISSEYVAPRNEIEQVIADVWKDILDIDKAGVYDNFFDLGGDSIISIQVVSHLKRRGLNIKPSDIFEHQCVAELAQVAGIATVIEAYQGTVVGVSPLTPIQRWFFEQDLENRHHFNQGVMFRSEMGINEEVLRKTLQVLTDHHDVLRMRFKKNGASHIQEFMPLGEDVSLVVKDLSENVNKDKALEEEVAELQSSLDIERGPVFRAGLYHIGSRDYLVLAGHHLVMDGVSWRILLEDILAGYDQTLKSEEIILPDKTTSYRDWAISLNEYARSDGILKEASYWEGVLHDGIPELPIDHDLGVNDIASTDVVSIELGDKDTHALLKGAPKAYNTEVNDLLLTALMRALQGWTGRDDVLFDLEGHGREDMIDGVDISRTVGWFTTIFPVALSIDKNADIGVHIKYVKERLHTIPNKGFNFGVLKYMYGRDFGGYTSAGISFNYLGQVPNMGSDSSVSIVDMDVKIMTDRHNKRSNLIDVVCIVADSHLTVEFIYSKNKHLEATINSLAKRFKEELLNVIHFCMQPEHEGYTPSDFELKDITQDQLDELLDEIQDI